MGIGARWIFRSSRVSCTSCSRLVNSCYFAFDNSKTTYIHDWRMLNKVVTLLFSIDRVSRSATTTGSCIEISNRRTC